MKIPSNVNAMKLLDLSNFCLEMQLELLFNILLSALMYQTSFNFFMYL